MQKGLVHCEICGEQSSAWSCFPAATLFSSLLVLFHTQTKFTWGADKSLARPTSQYILFDV
jgi:hypothetical protein